MLDYFAIFTKGGALLWTLQFTALKHNPVEAINSLIRTFLLEERSGENYFVYAPKVGSAQALKWTFNNTLGLVFVAVYQRTLSLLYVDELLQLVRQDFSSSYQPGRKDYRDFDDAFKRMCKDSETKADDAKRLTAVRNGGKEKQPIRDNGKAGNTRTSQSVVNGGSVCGTRTGGSEDDDGAGGSDGSGGVPDSDDAGDGNSKAADKGFDKSRLSKVASRRGPGGAPRAPARRVSDKQDKKKEEVTPTKAKKGRKWESLGRGGGDDDSALDFSERPSTDTLASSDADGGAAEAPLQLGQSLVDVDESEYEYDEDVRAAELGAGDAKRGAGAPGGAAARSGVLGSFMSRLAISVAGKQSLTHEDVAPALAEMKKKLMERNVAEEISQQICDSVSRSLEGKKLSSFTGVGAFVRRAFEESLSGILNKRQVDVLLEISRAKLRKEPYVIVFCGVNGVGKSTNLAKIAYWLGQHQVKALIAACDTFRAGAVEQLKTHCKRLQVPLYERGYERDPAKVAAEAVKAAKREGRDVVLVDTAGRMQDNEPLMRALANLIAVNQPQLVLFVGEALVGNDAVDQLVKFNRALYDLAPLGATKRHTIDGIVLTKFDTIDDKVGAALSMVYTSGAPVMFVGCGQTYVDLKKLNVKSVVNSLLK